MKVIGSIGRNSGYKDYIDGTLVMLTEYEYEQLECLMQAYKNDTEVFRYIKEFSSVVYMINHIKKVVDDFEELTKDEL